MLLTSCLTEKTYHHPGNLDLYFTESFLTNQNNKPVSSNGISYVNTGLVTTFLQLLVSATTAITTGTTKKGAAMKWPQEEDIKKILGETLN